MLDRTQLVKAIRELRELMAPKCKEEYEGTEGTKVPSLPSEMDTVATPSGSSVCSVPNLFSLPAGIPSPSPSASTTCPGSWTIAQEVEQVQHELQVPTKPCLPPLKPNEVRVHIGDGEYRDVQINPADDTMTAVYRAIQADFPAALLTTYCPGEVSKAIFRTDNRVSEVK